MRDSKMTAGILHKRKPSSPLLSQKQDNALLQPLIKNNNRSVSVKGERDFVLRNSVSAQIMRSASIRLIGGMKRQDSLLNSYSTSPNASRFTQVSQNYPYLENAIDSQLHTCTSQKLALKQNISYHLFSKSNILSRNYFPKKVQEVQLASKEAMISGDKSSTLKNLQNKLSDFTKNAWRNDDGIQNWNKNSQSVLNSSRNINKISPLCFESKQAYCSELNSFRIHNGNNNTNNMSNPPNENIFSFSGQQNKYYFEDKVHNYQNPQLENQEDHSSYELQQQSLESDKSLAFKEGDLLRNIKDKYYFDGMISRISSRGEIESQQTEAREKATQDMKFFCKLKKIKKIEEQNDFDKLKISKIDIETLVLQAELSKKILPLNLNQYYKLNNLSKAKQFLSKSFPISDQSNQNTVLNNNIPQVEESKLQIEKNSEHLGVTSLFLLKSKANLFQKVLGVNYLGLQDEEKIKEMEEYLESDKYNESFYANNSKIGNTYIDIIAAIFAQKKKRRSLKQVFLKNNRIDNSSLSKIIGSLPLSIRQLDISNNLINHLGSKYITELLNDNAFHNLEYLNLSKNRLGDIGAMTILNALATNNFLKILDFSNNKLTNLSSSHIQKILSTNSYLDELYLGHNTLMNESLKYICDGIESNYNLKVLDLQHNSLGGNPNPNQHYGKRLIKIIGSRSSSFRHLDLSYNRFEKPEALEIAKEVRDNFNLYGFHFEGNPCNFIVDARGFLVENTKQFEETGRGMFERNIRINDYASISEIHLSTFYSALQVPTKQNDLLSQNQHQARQYATDCVSTPSKNHAYIERIKNVEKNNSQMDQSLHEHSEMEIMSESIESQAGINQKKNCQYSHQYSNVSLLRQTTILSNANTPTTKKISCSTPQNKNSLNFSTYLANPSHSLIKNPNFNSLPLNRNTHTQKEQCSSGEVCWICDGYKEVKFTFKLNYKIDREPVYIHLSFEEYQPFRMEKDLTEPNKFFVYRMCPPDKPITYFFSNPFIKQISILPYNQIRSESNPMNALNSKQKLKVSLLQKQQNSKASSESPKDLTLDYSDIKGYKVPLPYLMNIYKNSSQVNPPNSTVSDSTPQRTNHKDIRKEDMLAQVKAQEERKKEEHIARVNRDQFDRNEVGELIYIYPRKLRNVLNGNYDPIIRSIIRQVQKPFLQDAVQQKIGKPNGWDVKKSIFAEYKRDDYLFLKNCFESDWSLSKLNKIIRSEDDREDLKQILYDLYPYLKNTYKILASQNLYGEVFAVSAQLFLDLISCTHIIDSKSMKPSDVEFNFASTNALKEKNPRNPDKALVRYQFMEVMVRIAFDKYIKNKTYATFSDAFRQILYEEELLNVLMKAPDSQEWREKKLWTQQCDSFLKSKFEFFKRVFEKWCGSRNKDRKVFGPQPKFVSCQEFKDFLSSFPSLFSEQFSDREVNQIFAESMMTQIDEISKDTHMQMSLIEFIEGFARICDKISPVPYGEDKNAYTKEELIMLPLHMKMESIVAQLESSRAFLVAQQSNQKNQPQAQIQRSTSRSSFSQINMLSMPKINSKNCLDQKSISEIKDEETQDRFNSGIKLGFKGFVLAKSLKKRLYGKKESSSAIPYLHEEERIGKSSLENIEDFDLK